MSGWCGSIGMRVSWVVVKGNGMWQRGTGVSRAAVGPAGVAGYVSSFARPLATCERYITSWA